MTITDAQPHRRYGSGYGVSFWRGNTASNEKDADRVVVATGAPGMPYPEMHFSLPAERHEFENLERMLEKAFAAGDANARQEIRSALGVPQLLITQQHGGRAVRQGKIEKMRDEVCRRVAAILGDDVICNRCGATLKTMNGACTADLLDPCPGFRRVDEVQVPIERDVFQL